MHSIQTYKISTNCRNFIPFENSILFLNKHRNMPNSFANPTKFINSGSFYHKSIDKSSLPNTWVSQCCNYKSVWTVKTTNTWNLVKIRNICMQKFLPFVWIQPTNLSQFWNFDGTATNWTFSKFGWCWWMIDDAMFMK